MIVWVTYVVCWLCFFSLHGDAALLASNHTIVAIGGTHFGGTSIVENLLRRLRDASGLEHRGFPEDEGRFYFSEELKNILGLEEKVGALGAPYPVHVLQDPLIPKKAASGKAAHLAWRDLSKSWNLEKRILVVKDIYSEARFADWCHQFQSFRGILVLRHPLRVATRNGRGAPHLRFRAWLLSMLLAYHSIQRCDVMFIRLEDLVAKFGEATDNVARRHWKEIAQFVGSRDGNNDDAELPFTSCALANSIKANIQSRRRDLHGNRGAEKIQLQCADLPRSLDVWFNETVNAQDLAANNRDVADSLALFGYSLEPPLVRTPMPFNKFDRKRWFLFEGL